MHLARGLHQRGSMPWLVRTSTLLTALTLAACGTDASTASGSADGGGSSGSEAEGATSSGGTDGSAETDGGSSGTDDGSSGSSSGGADASPLDHEGCEASSPAGEQTPEALEIAASIEAEIDTLGRADDIALLDFGVQLGQGAGGADIFCVSLALYSDWYASLESRCIQDIDPEVVLAEISEIVAAAPTLPSFAPQADVEATASGCLGTAEYVPCSGGLGFGDSTFDPSVVVFSTGEESDECTFTSNTATIDAATAELIACESDSSELCDTEG